MWSSGSHGGCICFLYFETLVIHFFETLVIQILLTIRMIALKSKEKPVIKIIGLVLTIGGLLFLLL